MSKPLDALLKWAKDNGSEIDERVSWKVTDRGISAIFNSNDVIESTDALIKVPESLTITPIQATKVFGIDEKTILNKDRNPLTKLLLAKLKFDKSKTIISEKDSEFNLSTHFKTYIDILPTGKEIGSPLFWDGDERSLINGTDAFISIDHQIFELLEEWFTVVSNLENNTLPDSYKDDLSIYKTLKDTKKTEQFAKYFNNPNSWTSFPAYLWASSIFKSRGFPYFLGDSKAKSLNEVMLLPIFDLLNHNNDVKVHWDTKVDTNGDKSFIFQTFQQLHKDDEIYNSYGPKSNLALLLGYGFVLNDNKDDYTTLSLQIPDGLINQAKVFGIEGLTSSKVSFVLQKTDLLPESLIKLFAFLVKNKSDKSITLLNKLYGLSQLSSILVQKIESINKKNDISKEVLNSIDEKIVQNAKIYKNSQKLLYQLSFEEITKLEKSLLKQYKPLSFKTIYKNDKNFANSLLLIFGIKDYEQLVKSDEVDRALLLWIIRVGNKNQYINENKNILPDWISFKYQQILKTLVVSTKDVEEYRDIYKALFPAIANKIPEIYNRGDWSIKSFITAGNLIDEIKFTRTANKEVFLIDEIIL